MRFFNLLLLATAVSADIADIAWRKADKAKPNRIGQQTLGEVRPVGRPGGLRQKDKARTRQKGQDLIKTAKGKAKKATECKDFSGPYLAFYERNLIGNTGTTESGAVTGAGALSIGPDDNGWLQEIRLMCVEQEGCLVRGNTQIVYDLAEGDGLGPIPPGPFTLYDQFAGVVYKDELTFVESLVVGGTVSVEQGIMNFDEGSLRGVCTDTNPAAGADSVGGFNGVFFDARKVDNQVIQGLGLDPDFCDTYYGLVAEYFPPLPSPPTDDCLLGSGRRC